MKKKSLQKILVGLLAITMLLTCSGCSNSDSDEVASSDSGDTTYSLDFPSDDYTTKTVTVSTSAGSKSVSYYLYQDVVYVTDPVDADYESMNVYVPYEIDGSSVSTEQAPILLNIGVGGYMSSQAGGLGDNGNYALAAGYVVVSAGCRGRDNYSSSLGYYGKAPAAMVDLKAAVRYIRYNYNAGVFPGNADLIVSSGGSAGGALSSLLGASGNSSLYDSYLEDLGAADTDDNIYAVGAWSPIMNLDHSDMAYEWEYGDLGSVNSTISDELQYLFEDYQNGLALSGKDSYGTLTSASINDYILTCYLEPSATEYLNALSSTARSSYLSANTWITWDGTAATFTFSDYLNHIGNRGKGVPAFDSFFDSSSYSNVNTSESAEVVLFGDSTTDARHFTDYSLQKTTGDSSQTISSGLATIVNMMNPMYFIMDCIENGSDSSGVAQYWYIRDGSVATDTSAIIIVDLATAAENLLGEANVDAWEDWDEGHNVNTDPEEFIEWVGDVTGY
jgi:acetyl esterase/lipase